MDSKLLSKVIGREDELVEKYIKDGPTVCKKSLGIRDDEWREVFDYLVFEQALLYKCVAGNAEFFVDMYVKYGTAHVREVLDIEDSKYDMVWELLFDFIAIAHEGLYYHVLEHRDRYMVAMKARGGDFVRKVLGIWKDKYDENWERILDFMLNAVCDAIFSEQTFENSLRTFSLMVNGMREHRPIFKSGILV